MHEVRSASNHNLRLGNYGNNVDKNLSANNITLVSSTNPADDIEHIWNDVVKQRADLGVRKLNDKNTNKAVEIIVGASAEFFDDKTPKQTEEFFRDQLAWLKEHYGDRSQIVHAVVHLDEPGAAPHLQVLFAPVVYKLESKANKKVLTAPTFSADNMVGNRGDFKRARDSQHEALKDKWGLDRGIEYTQSTDPEKIKQDKANLKKFKTIKNEQARELEAQNQKRQSQLHARNEIIEKGNKVLKRKAHEVKKHHAQTKKMIKANEERNAFIDSIDDIEVLKAVANHQAEKIADRKKREEVYRAIENKFAKRDDKELKRLTKQLSAPKYTPKPKK